MLFAQQFGGRQVDEQELAFLLGFICSVLLIVIVVMFFFLRTLHVLLKKCHPRNRAMEPGHVWFNFIPCFNFIWQFVTVVKVEDTLRAELTDRQLARPDDSFGKGYGLTACILNIVGNVISKMGDALDRSEAKLNPQRDPAFNIFDILNLAILVVVLICFIIYWVKMAGYSRQLSGHSREDGYDGERRRPSRLLGDDDGGHVDP